MNMPRPPKKEPLPAFNIRMNEDVARSIKVEAAKLDLKHGEFVEGLFNIAKKNGLIDKIKAKK